MCYRTSIPKITWSDAFAKTWDMAYPLTNWVASSYAMDGSQFLQIESGEEDAWVINTQYYLEGDVRFITTDGTLNPLATGWEGDSGVDAFLIWARNKEPFRFYPDKNSATYITSYLVEPTITAPVLEPDGTKTVRIVIRNATTAYDGY